MQKRTEVLLKRTDFKDILQNTDLIPFAALKIEFETKKRK